MVIRYSQPNRGGKRNVCYSRKKQTDVFSKLKEVSVKAPILKGKNNMIELDPENQQHQDWYDIDNFEEE